MPRGRTDQMTRSVSVRDDFEREEAYYNHLADRAYVEESASEIRGRYHGPPPRGYAVSRIASSRDDYSDYASGPPRGYRGHRAMGGEGYEDSVDDESLAAESVAPRSGGTRGHRGTVGEDYDSFDDGSLAGEPATRRFGGTHGHGGMRGNSYDESFDDDPLAGEFAGPHYAGGRGQHGQGPPGTGSRYTDTSYTDTTSEDITDDESDHRPRGARGGIAASAHRGAPLSRSREVSPSPRRRGMYPCGRAGSVDSFDSEADPGGHNPGLRQYGALGSYGRHNGGRDLDRRRC